MMIWIAILPLILGAMLYVLWPLLRSKPGKTVLDHAVAQFEAQKEALVHQVAAGLITRDESRAAQAEQARTLLALQTQHEMSRQNDMQGDALARSIRRRKRAAMLMLVFVPLLSLGLYLRLGQPTLLDQPLAARQAEAASRAANVDGAIAKLEAHLLKNPDDGKGFEVIAPVYMRLERFEDAAHAYGRVVTLLGETAPRLTDWAESLLAQAGGVITPEAQAALEQAVKLDPAYPKAQFYLIRLMEQKGEFSKAYQAYLALMERLPEGAARSRVMMEIERLREEGKAPPHSGAPPVAGSAADAIARLPSGEQEQMIRTMVEGLAARLAQKGGTYEEWLRLTQARLVLGEREMALAHIEEAIRIFKEDDAAIKPLTLMREQVLAAPSGLDKKGQTP